MARVTDQALIDELNQLAGMTAKRTIPVGSELDDQLNAALESQLAAEEPMDADAGLMETVLAGLGSGFTRAGQGVQQLAHKAVAGLLPGDRLAGVPGAYADQVQQERAFFDQTPVGQSLTGQGAQLVGQALPFIAAPGGIAGGLATRIGTGAASGAAQGALDFVGAGDSRMENTLWGAGLGGGIPAILGTPGAVKAGLSKLADTKATRQAKETFALGEKEGVRIMAPDVGGSTAKSVENFAPFTAGARRQQQEQAFNAATRRVEEARDPMKALYRNNLEFLKEGARQPGPRRTQFQGALREVEELQADDDWAVAMQQSGIAESLRRRQNADELYSRVENLAGDTPVMTESTASQISALRRAEMEAPSPNKEYTGLLRDYSEWLASPRDYGQMRQLRSRVKNTLSDMEKGRSGVVGTEYVAGMAKVRDAIEDDMARFADSGRTPGLKEANETADSFYRQQVAPYKNINIAKALRDENPDEIWGRFARIGDKKDKLQGLVNVMDEQGTAAARYGMLSEAMTKAYDPDSQTFSPAKMAGFLDKYSGARDTLFQGDGADELRGFTKLMRAISRSGHVDADPMTGSRLVPAVTAIGAAATARRGMANLAATAATGGMATYFTRNPAARRALVALSDYSPNSPEGRQIIDYFQGVLRSGAIEGQQATEEDY